MLSKAVCVQLIIACTLYAIFYVTDSTYFVILC